MDEVPPIEVADFSLHIGTSQDVSRILKLLRARSGKSLRYVAAKVDCDVSTLVTAEKGTHVPLLATLIKLFKFYGETVTMGWDPEGGLK